jgi:hypothetical protein
VDPPAAAAYRTGGKQVKRISSDPKDCFIPILPIGYITPRLTSGGSS